MYVHSWDRPDDSGLVLFRNEREIRQHLLEAIENVELNYNADYDPKRFFTMSTDRLFNYVLDEVPEEYDDWGWTPVLSIVTGIGMKVFGKPTEDEEEDE